MFFKHCSVNNCTFIFFKVNCRSLNNFNFFFFVVAVLHTTSRKNYKCFDEHHCDNYHHQRLCATNFYCIISITIKLYDINSNVRTLPHRLYNNIII